eukprot:4948104-Prymnesium_polylepis.1
MDYDHALVVHDGVASLEQVVFAEHQTGAVAITGGELQVVDCNFLRNRAPKGAAVLASGGKASVKRTLFEENQADMGAVEHVESDANVDLADNTHFSRNTGHSIELGPPPASVRYTLPAPPGRWIFAPGGNTSQLDPGVIDSDFPFACSPGL